MPLCIFEDSRVGLLDPLALTRPASDLLCGSCSLEQRQCRAFGVSEVSLVVRPLLAATCRLRHPGVPINEPDSLRRPGTVLVNARWLPPAGFVPNLQEGRVGLIGEEVAYVVLPQTCPQPEAPATGPSLALQVGVDVPSSIESFLKTCKAALPHTAAGGTLLAYPWDLVQHNAQALGEDLAWRREEMGQPPLPSPLAVVGPREEVVVHPEAVIDPFVVADSRKGPVIIDRGARIFSFSLLEGPCYVGPESWVLGAKLRGGTVGPHCRVGGEVEASILHGYSNKYHDGFLGHSYVGEWVNLAAGTQVSDLRNDYGEVTMMVAGARIATGLTKVGAFLGDHTKTGLNTLLNTGTVAGVFCGLLPSGSYLPRLIPSFCSCAQGQLQEHWDLWQLLQTAAKAMQRRGCELSAAHSDLYFALYDQTASFRRCLLREAEQKRLRRRAAGS
jgi:UDP-N-acetylglucosamine diphosphorylase/glucosamine-1-phosphate N-acetyltransferase